MTCASCESRPIAVTVETIAGTVSLCGACAVKGNYDEFVASLMQVADLEYYWRLDSSTVREGRHVSP